MANPFQRAVTRRKWTYFLLIIGLFTLSLLWRGKLQVPLSNAARATYMNQERRGGADADARPDDAPNKVAHYADWLYSRTIEQQASSEALELRELEQGDPEITSTAMRLGTLGSRGFVITALWRAAIEKFKRNEWHEFEFLVRTVTRLQPNFTTPWIYQSWNLSYNVSVENDRLNDMYFYITRGIELLAEGERMNRKSPDMRYQIGFYYQNKFSVSDKVRTLSSLFQLSCVPPEDRKPARLRDKTGQIDLAAFAEFAKKNPQLCRRLADQLGYTRPEQVVQFLEDNQSVPTRFDKTKNDKLFPAEQQFPALPLKLPDTGVAGVLANQFRFTANTPPDEMSDAFDAFQAAGAWYAYSMEPLPPTSADGLPEYSPTLTGVDRFRYRIPKSPMLVLFRQAAPRAQSYRAERLTKEGWLDAKTVWFPDKRADSEADRWFPTGGAVGLDTPANAQSEWAKAFNMWSDHARANGLNLEAEPAKLARLQEAARGVPADPNLLLLDDDALRARGLTRERVRAADTLRTYEQQRQVTNIEFFLTNSELEKDDTTVDARKAMWEAKDEDRAGNKLKAKQKYAEGINLTREALRKFPAYHRTRTSKGEEDLLENQTHLIRLLELDPEVDAQARKLAVAARGVIPSPHVDEETLRKAYAQSLAYDRAGVMVTTLDRRVQGRADQLMKLPPTDPARANVPVDQGRDAVLNYLVTKGEFKYLWEYVSEATENEANRWVSKSTEQAMAERLQRIGRPGQTP
jgi:hypothetical protein